jgi:type II secretory pathway pseudopilin PulG
VKYPCATKFGGVTLVEILIVTLVIAILAALALPNFQKSREYAFNREAKANLKLIQAAERIYYIENAFFMPCSVNYTSTSAMINTYLRLTLPTGSHPNNMWNYTTTTTGTAQAVRTGSDGRVWTLSTNSQEPSCVGAEFCPN